MNILDGNKAKVYYLKELKEKLLKAKTSPQITIISVGEDEASKIYIRQKEKMANLLGYRFNNIRFSEDITTKDVIELINKLNNDDSVDGILVQMPLPKHLDEKLILNNVNYLKDVDGLTDINMGRLAHNKEGIVPCTPKGIMMLLAYYNIEIEGKNICIVGRSDLVGKPLASLMINNNATVTLCHSKTNNLKNFTSNADILVVAVGIPNFIKEDYVKKDAIVIDVGISRIDNKLVGDVDFENVKTKASFITPVPGGVGPMTVTALGENIYKSYTLQKR